MNWSFCPPAAYARSAQPQSAQALLAETDRHFRQAGRWTESSIAQLAWCCLSNDLFEQAVGYYAEVIPLHQRTQPNRGIGNGTLVDYYGYQSQAWTGLGNTIEAVESAAAGVVAWGSSRGQRDSASYRIEEALSSAKDLDDYVAHLDKQVAETDQDSPLIRQKLGVVYARRNQPQKAIAQFLASTELQPNDLVTQAELIKAYDSAGDSQGAIRQTLALLEFDRHNLELYKKLAERLKSDEALSERASTMVVEAAPNEAGHHQALAEFRQEQNRWDEAIEQWRHVARLRSLEPGGLLKLTEALIHEKRWDEARESIGKLNQVQWPARFSDVGSTTERLQRQLPEASR